MLQQQQQQQQRTFQTGKTTKYAICSLLYLFAASGLMGQEAVGAASATSNIPRTKASGRGTKIFTSIGTTSGVKGSPIESSRRKAKLKESRHNDYFLLGTRFLPGEGEGAPGTDKKGKNDAADSQETSASPITPSASTPSTSPSPAPTSPSTTSPSPEPTMLPTVSPPLALTPEPTMPPTLGHTSRPISDATMTPTHFPTASPTMPPTTPPTSPPTLPPSVESSSLVGGPPKGGVAATLVPTHFPTTSPSIPPTTPPSYPPKGVTKDAATPHNEKEQQEPSGVPSTLPPTVSSTSPPATPSTSPPIVSATSSDSSASTSSTTASTTDHQTDNNEFIRLSLGEVNEFENGYGTDESNSKAGLVVGVIGAIGLVIVFSVVLFLGKQRRRRPVNDGEIDIESGETKEVVAATRTSLRTSLRTSVAKDDASLLFKGDEDAPQPFDLTGDYKMIDNEKMDAFLDAVGVPWAVRSIAARTLSKHSIVHKGNLFTVKFKGIPRTTYVLGGPAIATCIRETVFEDIVNYGCHTDDVINNPICDEENEATDSTPVLENGDVVRMIKRPAGADYEFHLQWSLLSEGKAALSLTSTAHFDDGREVVQSIQRYKRKDPKKALDGSPASKSDPFSDTFSDTSSVFSVFSDY